MTDKSLMERDVPLQFRLLENGQVIGFIEYYSFDKVAIVTHTEVNARLEGRGHGSRLAHQALEFFSRQGKQVVPVCGFFAQYVRKNQQFAHLITPESRRIFNIGLSDATQASQADN